MQADDCGVGDAAPVYVHFQAQTAPRCVSEPAVRAVHEGQAYAAGDVELCRKAGGTDRRGRAAERDEFHL